MKAYKEQQESEGDRNCTWLVGLFYACNDL